MNEQIVERDDLPMGAWLIKSKTIFSRKHRVIVKAPAIHPNYWPDDITPTDVQKIYPFMTPLECVQNCKLIRSANAMFRKDRGL